MFVVLAAAIALLAWMVLGGGNGNRAQTSGPSSHPVSSIGPSSTQGGSGGSSDGSKTGGASSGSATPSTGPSGSPSAPAGTTGGTNGGTVVTVTGGTGANGGSGGSGGSGSSGGTGSASGGTGGGGSVTPPNSTGTMLLPTCAAADVELALTSASQTYTSSQWPTFRLAITNTSGAACRLDLGAKSAVLTISSDANSHVWSSGDCPKVTAVQWYAVPASGAPLTAEFQWSRTTSAPGCTPGGGGGGVGAGSYVARVGVGSVPVQPSHQFRLATFGS